MSSIKKVGYYTGKVAISLLAFIGGFSAIYFIIWLFLVPLAFFAGPGYFAIALMATLKSFGLATVTLIMAVIITKIFPVLSIRNFPANEG